MGKSSSPWRPLPRPTNELEVQSQTVDFLRLPFIFLVLVVHTNPHLSPFAAPISSIDYNALSWGDVFALVGRAGSVLGYMTVPFFFLTSGYYFFHQNAPWNATVYIDKLKKRIRTLLIPYLLWNAICVVGNAGHDLWKCMKYGWPDDRWAAFAGTYLHPGHLLDLFWSWSKWDVDSTNVFGFDVTMSAPAIVPFWFLRDLIVISLLSPVVYWFARKCNWILPLLLGVAYILKLWIVPGLNVSCVFFFTFGAWLSLHGKNMVTTFHPWRYISLAVACVTLLAAVLKSDWVYNYLFWHTFCLTGMMTFISFAPYWLTRPDKRAAIIPALWQTGFFVYALHGMRIGHFAMLSAGMKLADTLVGGPTSAFGALIAYFIAPVLGFALCVATYFIMKRFGPKFLGILTGGRV